MKNDSENKDFGYPIRILQDFMITWYIYMGLKLGIFDYLKQKGWSTPEEISRDLNLRTRLVNSWCNSMYVEKLLIKEENTFSLTKWAKTHLCKDSKSYIGFIIYALEYFTVAFEHFESNFKIDEKYTTYTPNQMLNITKNIAPVADIITPFILNEIKNEINNSGKQIKMLDIGCGMVRYLINFAKRIPKFKGVGIDIEPLIIEQAKKNIQKEGFENIIKLRVDSAFNFKLDEKFDLILLSNIIQAFDDTKNNQLLKNVINHLESDGKVIIIDCLLDRNLKKSKFNVLFDLYLKFESPYAQLYTLEHLINLCKKVGLKFIKNIHLFFGVDLIIFKGNQNP